MTEDGTFFYTDTWYYRYKQAEKPGFYQMPYNTNIDLPQTRFLNKTILGANGHSPLDVV